MCLLCDLGPKRAPATLGVLGDEAAGDSRRAFWLFSSLRLSQVAVKPAKRGKSRLISTFYVGFKLETAS